MLAVKVNWQRQREGGNISVSSHVDTSKRRRVVLELHPLDVTPFVSFDGPRLASWSVGRRGRVVQADTGA